MAIICNKKLRLSPIYFWFRIRIWPDQNKLRALPTCRLHQGQRRRNWATYAHTSGCFITWPQHPIIASGRRACFLAKRKYNSIMKNDVVPVQIRGILPANSGCALFVGNDEKVFVINVEPQMGQVIGMFLRETPKERPLTHDLMQSIFKGFGISAERVIITELKNSTYFARLILSQNNEVARKLVEIDARPSDCLAIAAAQKKPIFVSRTLFEQVEDMSEVLDRINEGGGESE
jgi:uncharacterized protein